MKTGFNLWLTGAIAGIGALYFNYEGGFLEMLWHVDFTKICFAVMAMFMYGYANLGFMILKGGPETEEDLDIGHWLGSKSMQLGMLGTVLGFIVVLGSFSGIDFSDQGQVQELMKIFVGGMSTALYTTAAGLMCALGLSVSYHLAYIRYLKK